jgi:hypothetical protein
MPDFVTVVAAYDPDKDRVLLKLYGRWQCWVEGEAGMLTPVSQGLPRREVAMREVPLDSEVRVNPEFIEDVGLRLRLLELNTKAPKNTAHRSRRRQCLWRDTVAEETGVADE